MHQHIIGLEKISIFTQCLNLEFIIIIDYYYLCICFASTQHSNSNLSFVVNLSTLDFANKYTILSNLSMFRVIYFPI